MTRPLSVRWLRSVPVAAALVLSGAAPGLAQGTQAEREACTPDALKLCSDTIPDVSRTTACMKAHQAELSPRCHAVIAARTEPTRRMRPPVATRRIDRDEREADVDPDERRFDRQIPPREDDDAPGERRYLYLAPDGREAEAADPGDRARARAEIGRLCDEEMIDPRTCELTERSLR